MPKTIFFSWQADRPARVCRNFIEACLERAIGSLHEDLPVEEAQREQLAIDRDTKGVAGMPPIVETIFAKIDSAAICLVDVTFVGNRHDGRPTPNPNVLIEYGWALKSLTHSRIIAVMNVAYGAPSAQTLPFDMQHLRFPITFNVPEDASAEVRKAEKEKLAKILAQAIRAIMDSPEQTSDSSDLSALEFLSMQSKHGSARFRALNEPVGFIDSDTARSTKEEPQPVFLKDGPAFWLRVMPVDIQSKNWSVPEIIHSARSRGSLIVPMNPGPSLGCGFNR